MRGGDEPDRQDTVYLSFDGAPSLQVSESKAAKKNSEERPMMESDANPPEPEDGKN